MSSLKDIKRKLTDEQVISFLKHLGSKRYINNDKNIIFQTICHNKPSESNKMKLYYIKDRKLFHCFTSCESIGDIYKLAGHVLNLDASESAKYVLKFFGISSIAVPYEEEDFGFEVEDDEEVIFQSIKLENIEVEPLEPIKRQNIMRMFIRYYCREWLKDGISKETMDKYDIKFSPEKLGVIIPHHNIFGEIVGVRIRNLEEYSIETFGKYTPLHLNGVMYNHQLSRNVYSLDKSKEHIKIYKKVIVFEGEKSPLILDSWYGGRNPSVAICGSSFSRYQMKLILDTCGEDIEFIIAFDKQWSNSEEETQWRKKIERMCKPLIENGKRVSVMWDRKGLLEYKNAPCDNGKEVFEILLKEREEITIDNAKDVL